MPTESIDISVADSIREYFRADRSRMTMMASRKFQVPERQVLEALIDEWPITRLRDDAFPALMQALTEFGLMRVFVRSQAAVIEAVGLFGGYSETGPFFNVQTDTLDMHIMHEEIGSIFAVEKWGHDTTIATYSFQFFDHNGAAAFKAFLWDSFPDVPAARIAAFRATASELAETAGTPTLLQ